jgi:hypothetical protein
MKAACAVCIGYKSSLRGSVSKLPGDNIMLSSATSRRVVKRAHPDRICGVL